MLTSTFIFKKTACDVTAVELVKEYTHSYVVTSFGNITISYSAHGCGFYIHLCCLLQVCKRVFACLSSLLSLVDLNYTH